MSATGGQPRTWRARAREVILAEIAKGRALDLTDDQIRANIDAAYPFGERAYYPYRAWLTERRLLIPGPARGELAKLRAWENGSKIVDPGFPKTPLEEYLENLDKEGSR